VLILFGLAEELALIEIGLYYQVGTQDDKERTGGW
jgi:hypothetical protein